MAAAATPVTKHPHHYDLRGLYAITDEPATQTNALTNAVEAALRGGARIVQYRDKSNDRERRLAEASALRTLTRRHDVPLLINDDVELAAAIGADGVHLGRDDAAIGQARACLPAGSLVGVSCYNSFDLARQAAAAGADYIAFGSFFPSPTKPAAVRATPDLLARTRSELGLPVVAIGGISPENGAALVSAGADMLAVISALFAAPDVRAAARAFSDCFTPSKENSR
ncbi:MAG: thiamine phosphate synthase [Gammaproteobacteria bacterium]|nr:thiamine phosphate synthase [Gammaproteobacteria bacterium]